MVAGGMLPLCTQNSNSVSPSVTVWLSGLVEKEFSNTKRETQRQREIHDQALLFLYAEIVSIEEEGREERRRRRQEREGGLEERENGKKKGGGSGE